MNFRTVRHLPLLLSLLTASTTKAQTVETVLITKGSGWVQTSPADPVINPRNPGPGYGGPFNFLVNVEGTNISGIVPPVITLAPGSLYPTQSPARHNGGVLTYNLNQESWNYGSDGNNWGGQTEAERDASFAFGTYGMNVLGESFNLDFSATAFPANTPKVTLSGGAWSGGKYLIDVTQPLTITTNAFTNFGQNADGAMYMFFGDDPDDLIDQLVFHSDNVAGPNFLTTTIPANTLVAGRDYETNASFYAIMGKRGSISTRLDAATYERFTSFKISAINPIQPGAQATFYGVGDLDGGGSFSEVRDAIKSGGVLYAVGDSASTLFTGGGDTGFVWSSTNGLVPLPDITTNFSTALTIQPKAITPDGAYIASQARTGSGGSQRHAVRVTRSGLTNLDLGTFAGFPNLSQANTISNDASVLYGSANYAAGKPARAVRFTAAGPTITAIPFLNVGDDNSASADRGASADGSVMVGRSVNSVIDAGPTSPGVTGLGLGSQAFRYVHGSGVSGIPFIGGGTWSSAVAVSLDGNLTLVRGNSTSAPQGEMYVHNATTGSLTSYGTPNGSRLPGGIVGLTADGSIVATSFNVADNPTNATVIRNAHGWHDFQTLVERAGVDLSGWNIRNDTLFGVSPDGTLVWGRGAHNGNREGFVVEFAPGYLAAATEPDVYSAPAPAIVGAWTVGDTTLPNAWAVLIFFSNGYYMHIQMNDVGDSTGADGFERGQYTWDAATGAVTFTTLLDTNGDIGLSGADGATGVTLTVAGDTATLTFPGEDPHVLTRVVGSNPLVGAWGDAAAADNSVALVFLPNGYYVMAQDGDSTPAGDPSGHDGMEWGTYSWDSVTGAVTATTLVDTNGQWGLSHPQGPQTFTVSNDLRTLSIADNAGAFLAPRVGVASATVSLGNLTATYDGTPKLASVTTAPAGLTVDVTYDGGSTLPVTAGNYAVVARITDSNYTGSASGTLAIGKATAGVALANLTQSYDGLPKVATVITTPGGLTTTVTYNGDPVAPSAAGLYSVVATVTDPNYVGSASGTLAILLPVQITGQPVTSIVNVGETATFTVLATGTDLHYQWRKGGINVGTDSPTLSISNAQSTDAGNYRVTVSNAVSSVVSNPVALTVITPLAITAQPQALTVVAGQKASFSITVTGSSPLYQWQKDGVDIVGATAATFIIGKASAADAGGYRVVVTNAAGFVISNSAALTVNVPPEITTQPVDVKISIGGTATFKVIATGTAPFSYQWRKGNTDILGATTDTLSFSNAQSALAGNYSVVVSNVAGSTKSSAAKLTVK